MAPKSIGIVEFTIFWLIGEENASKEATKPLPHWMQHDESGKNANGAMNLTGEGGCHGSLAETNVAEEVEGKGSREQ